MHVSLSRKRGRERTNRCANPSFLRKLMQRSNQLLHIALGMRG
jgi:hypothetical protein